jgi:hypothetical protein
LALRVGLYFGGFIGGGGHFPEIPNVFSPSQTQGAKSATNLQKAQLTFAGQLGEHVAELNGAYIQLTGHRPAYSARRPAGVLLGEFSDSTIGGVALAHLEAAALRGEGNGARGGGHRLHKGE